MSLLNDYLRATRRRPCPVCSKPDWCLLSRDDPADPPSVICARVESERRVGQAGWLHVLRGALHRPRLRTCVISAAPRRGDLGALARRLRSAVDPDILNGFAVKMGLPAATLRALGIGLAAGDDLDRVGVRWASHAWTFPMLDAGGDVVGIRLRLPNGKKFAVRGSRQGLFVPHDLGSTGRLFVGEGESDTAALLALGFDAIGRPGCMSCERLVVRFARARRTTEVVVVADPDEPGRKGAERLASSLALYFPVKVLIPAVQDVRDWVRAGATAADVTQSVERVAPVNVVVSKT